MKALGISVKFFFPENFLNFPENSENFESEKMNFHQSIGNVMIRPES
jgi:hypothetical protein